MVPNGMSMRSIFYTVALLSLVSFKAAAAPDQSYCINETFNKNQWKETIDAQFADVQTDKAELVNRLYTCLASPDPTIRDEIGYRGLSVLLRQATPSQPVLLALFERLSSDIAAHVNDPHGVFLPFAVLAYSEVIRTDRISPVLTNAQRQQAIDTISGYLEKQTDYRGFSDQIGWRHGLAHASDVILQLALNPALTRSQIIQAAHVVLQHISPVGAPAFTDGEGYRLARATAYLMLREEVQSGDWKTMLHDYAQASPRYADWASTYQTRQGLNYQHNKRSYYESLTSLTVFQNSPQLEPLAPEIAKLARSIR